MHDFTIDRLGGHSLLSRLAGYRVHVAVGADSQATGEFQLPAGTYEFYCSVDRHRAAGMEGTVVVGEQQAQRDRIVSRRRGAGALCSR
jgi:plastocyanin